METETNKKIAAKLVKVMEECAHVMKRGSNDFHHYSYATSADVLEKVKRASRKSSVACSDCGVLITDKVKSFSEQRYGKSLCMDCQKNYAAA